MKSKCWISLWSNLSSAYTTSAAGLEEERQPARVSTSIYLKHSSVCLQHGDDHFHIKMQLTSSVISNRRSGWYDAAATRSVDTTGFVLLLLLFCLLRFCCCCCFLQPMKHEMKQIVSIHFHCKGNKTSLSQRLTFLHYFMLLELQRSTVDWRSNWSFIWTLALSAKSQFSSTDR